MISLSGFILSYEVEIKFYFPYELLIGERDFFEERVKGRSDLRINQECRGKTASKPASILSIIQRIKKFEVNVH